MFSDPLDGVRLEDVVEKISEIVIKMLDQPECNAGRSLAGLYIQLFSKSLEGGNMSAKVCLQFLKSNLGALLIVKPPSFGIFLHSLTAQLAIITLQLEVMSINCIRYLENRDYLRIPVRSVDELLAIIPCIDTGTVSSGLENITLNDDIIQMWNGYLPEHRFKDYYLSLLLDALLRDDTRARFRLLELQIAIEKVIPRGTQRGVFVNSLVRVWYSHMLKLRIWLHDFLERAENKDFADAIRKHQLVLCPNSPFKAFNSFFCKS
ncbi:MAG: hypothetical protein ACTSP4_16955 [Candidatus Hodarchaeales archaeon]